MLRATRSEFTRLRRRAFGLGWLGISAGLSFLFVTTIFGAAASGAVIPAAAPGGAFPSLAALQGADGYLAGLPAVSTILGVVTLSFWAFAVASDYGSGLIRLLVQAQPSRLILLGGKVAALTSMTGVVAAIATVVVMLASLMTAAPSGIDTAAWATDLADIVPTAARSWASTFLALEIWGVVGLAIATLARNASVAIAVGASYVLIIEGVVRMMAENVADILPGATLTAIVSGGTPSIDHATAIALGVAYAVVGLVVAGATLVRRDIVD